MQGHVHGRVGRVGEKCALVERKVCVGVAQNQRRDAAIFEFLAQTAGKSDGEILFRERVAERLAAVVAAVAGIDNREVTARNGCRGTWW